MMLRTCLFLTFAFCVADVLAQDTYPWPLQPFDQSQRITGTFFEYRGPSNPHFHNGVDIPQLDGTPVYAVSDATVSAIDPNGSNAFVRAGRFAYVHIVPNPSLSLGDSVFAGQTVVGNILSGQGHVHFIDGFSGSQINAIRPGGGLTPYNDPWPPAIEDLAFSLQATGQALEPEALTGQVEITFRVLEKNADAGTSTAGLNNGAYFVGYRIHNRARTEVVYSPTPDGIQFQFDSFVSNAFVHNVFDADQASTSAHYYIITNNLTSQSAWDTEAVPAGDYTLEVFAGDTRDNVTSAFVDITVTRQDLVPPPPPTLRHATVQTDGVTFAFAGNTVPDLAGYHLYASADGLAWNRRADTTLFGPAEVPVAFPAALPTEPFYYLTAVDTAEVPNESRRTDVYAAATGFKNILIVDGFDRATGSGSWKQPTHDFVVRHGAALSENGFGFSSAANEAVNDGAVVLGDYDAVVWMLGDESTALETFSATEQALVQAYLEGGGKLFVTGSEIAWDLEARGSTSDTAFLHDYLKAAYAGDDAENLRGVGIWGEVFQGIKFAYGTNPYLEDYPDYFTPVAGGVAVLEYENGRIGGVGYKGTFGSGTETGAVLILGFPFETIGGSTARFKVMQRAMAFFFDDFTHTDALADLPHRFALHAPYPNPFRTETTLRFDLPEAAPVRLTAYDVLGRRVAVVHDASLPAGTHRLAWAATVAPGTYLLRLEAGTHQQTALVTKMR